MRPMSDHAPPDAPIRSRIPIDLPDDTEIQDADGRAVTWLALTLFVAFVIAAVLLLAVQP